MSRLMRTVGLNEYGFHASYDKEDIFLIKISKWRVIELRLVERSDGNIVVYRAVGIVDGKEVERKFVDELFPTETEALEYMLDMYEESYKATIKDYERIIKEHEQLIETLRKSINLGENYDDVSY